MFIIGTFSIVLGTILMGWVYFKHPKPKVYIQTKYSSDGKEVPFDDLSQNTKDRIREQEKEETIKQHGEELKAELKYSSIVRIGVYLVIFGTILMALDKFVK